MALLARARNVAAEFDYTDEEVRRCVACFREQMCEGLQKRKPSMCQTPTYVTRVASGTEKGLSFAVDLGGTNLRVCSVDLHGDTTLSVRQSKVIIPQSLKIAPRPEKLFTFIARRLEIFLRTFHTDCFERCDVDSKAPAFSLGLTFSFPVYQTGLNSGLINRWTKGFDIPRAIGCDVCKLLQDEITALNLPVKITALVNDAAGTIMSRAYALPTGETRTSIGAIFGTGTNGVYLEKLSNILKPLEGIYDASTGEMFVSIEWGSFDNHLAVLPVTSYDSELDKASVNPGDQMFEKRVSGMFLGELLRRAVLKLHEDPKSALFSMFDPKILALSDEAPQLHTFWAVDSSILSVAGQDDTKELKSLRIKIEESFGIPAHFIRVEDARAVKVVADAIGKRAARLAGMAIGAVILHNRRLVGSPEPLTPCEEIPISFGRLSTTKDVSTIIREAEVDAVDFRSSKLDTIPRHNEPNEQGIVDIGVDGSLIEHYPKFEDYMRQALRAIEGIEENGQKSIRIGIAKDGSSVGAAIIALLATKAS